MKLFGKPGPTAVLIVLLPGAALAGFGPMVWSPEGDRVVSWHRARTASLPLVESAATWLTDSLPPPPAISVDWNEGTLFLPAGAADGGPARLDRYSPGGTAPQACFIGLPSPATRTLFDEGRVLVAGAGYCDVRGLVTGALLDSLRWDPPKLPLDLESWEGGAALLLSDRLVLLDGEPDFRSLPVPGDGIALGRTEEGPVVVGLRDRSVVLIGPAGEERPIVDLEEGESILGADVTPDGRLAVLAYLVAPGSPAAYPSRIDVREVGTGDLAKRFRSARIRRGDKEFEAPIAAAFDPSGEYIAISWPSSGTQIWALRDWSLHALY